MTRSERWKTFTCFVLIHLAAYSGSATEIRLKQRVASRGSVVLLGDIAELSNGGAQSRSSSDEASLDVATLSRIELFPSPGVARSRTIRRREIRELLSLHGVDPQSIEFSGASSVIVRTDAQPRLQPVTAASHTKIAGAGQTLDQALRSVAKPIGLANQIVPTPTVEAQPGPQTELLLAPVRNIRRGEIIRASNVALVPVPLAGTGSASALGIRPVSHSEEVIGMAATRSIAANQPIDLRALERPIVVRRGDLVTVTSQAPGVRVETVARAKDNAALGDLVVLESIVNRKTYTARVTGTKMAAVYASGIRVSSPPEPPQASQTSLPSERRAAQ